MPELPEVQTIVSDLQMVIGYRFEGIWTDWPKALLPNKKAYVSNLIGRKIKAVSRRAKYIIFELDKDLMLVIHLRMTGHVLIRKSSDLPDRFAHVIFKLDRGLELRFEDQRKFGRCWLSDKKNYLKEAGLDKLGLEPLIPDFTYARFRDAFTSRKGILKTKLLDQGIIAGIGNIYADEICFASGLHPLSRVENLAEADLKQIYQNIKSILKAAVKARGSSVGEFIDSFGNPGKAQQKHFAYKRRGQPCKICNTKMIGIKVTQRGTTFCSRCQKLIK